MKTVELTKEFNLIITCKFSDFARVYTGLDDPDECMAFIEEQDQMAFVDSQSNGEFLAVIDLCAIWDSLVEVRVDDLMENGVYILSLTVHTPDVDNPYNDSIIECDYTGLEEILHEIITHTFRY